MFYPPIRVLSPHPSFIPSSVSVSGHPYPYPCFIPTQVELSTATSTDKEVIILGDFNCDLLPTRSVNAECKQLKSLLKFMNFNQLIKQPTRINQTTATLLDLIATNGSNISFSVVVDVSLGDHEMVLCTRKVNWRKLKPKGLFI